MANGAGILVIEGVVELAVLAAIAAASWLFRRQLSICIALLRDASIFLLLCTAGLYGAAQVREVLWVDYHTALTAPQPENEGWFTNKALFAELLWHTLTYPPTISVLVLAFCPVAINPDAVHIRHRGIESIHNGWLIRAVTPLPRHRFL
jgi:hypothetical protein